MTDIEGLRRLVERALDEINGWERAYPLTAFPEPDLERVAEVLRRDGLTLDSVSASNMRHVVKKLAPIVHELLDTIEAQQARIGELEAALSSARREALEEAAKVADRMQDAAASVLADRHCDDAAAQHDTAMEIASAIRALAEQGDG